MTNLKHISKFLFLFTLLFAFLQADDNSINGTCPGEIIEEIDGTSISVSHIENGKIGGGGNDRYRMTFYTAGTFHISASNSDSSRNENYRFYISRNNCGNADSDWNIQNTYNGTSPSFTIHVNNGDTIYIRLQSDSTLPNKGRHSYALSLNFTKNLPPMPDAGPDQIINLGDSITLDGSASSDSDGTITDYTWYENGVAKGSAPTLNLSELTAGTHTFTLNVTDNDGDSSSDTVIVKVNTPPVADAGPDQNITLGDMLTLDGRASTDDYNSITYTWTESTIPLRIDGFLVATNVDRAGTYTITLTVTDDNGLKDTDTLTVRVNTPPEVKDMNLTILKDTSINFELNVTDDDGDTIVSFPINTSPSHGILSGSDTNITYTPDANYTGIDTFTYKAYDGIDYSNEATVTITIVPPATAVHDDFNTTYNTLLNGNVLDNDLGKGILITENTSPTHGLLHLLPDGEFSYQPNIEFDGNDTFTYTIKGDFNNTSTATVSIFVYPPRVDLSIVKSAPAQVDAGLAMNYTLNIASLAGEQYLTAKNVRVTDTLPNGVVYNGIDAPSGWTCGLVGGTLTCDSSNIAPGYNDTITIKVFAPNSLGNISNTASITSETYDSNESNNQSTAETEITGPDVDMSIIKTASSTSAITSSSYTYTLSTSNTGSADASGVRITDTLDPALGFISIDGGTDWVCSEGLSVVCDYVANNGVYTAGSSAAPVVVTVRAPSQPTSISNTANVQANTPESNTGNNSSTVNVTVTSGTTQNNSVPLTKYIGFQLNGDYSLIGNTNINFRGTDPNQNYNDDINMSYINTDGTNGIYNSSSSILNINSTYRIKWAGLYWEGNICSRDASGTNSGAGTGCNWTNSSYTNYSDATSDIDTSLARIQFKVPNSNNYVPIQATTINRISFPTPPNGAQLSNYFPAKILTYSAFAEVTNLVRNAGNGVYSVGNIVLTEGSVYQGNYGGWTLVTVYEDANNTLDYKDISIFNGFQLMTQDNTPLSVSGFLTPRSGPINASLAFFAADGDPVNGGALQMKDKNNVFTALNNTANPATNIFNSTMTVFGNDINPGVTKTYGVDADRLDVSTFMNNAQRNANFLFDVSRPASTDDDTYSVSMFTFATDLTSPVIDNFVKRAVIIDADGIRRDASPNQPIYPGSQLEYTITFGNAGDEIAQAVEIFDDFDNDGLTPALDINHFDATKLKLFTGSTATAGNEVSNENCGYNAPQRRVYCKFDSIAIDNNYTMQFYVKVKDTLDSSLIGSDAKNTAYAKYKNPNGNTYTERYTTPEGEKVGGKSNALTAGKFTNFPEYEQDYISIDAINRGYDYAQDRNITTKIVNSPFSIKLVHRNINEEQAQYQAWQYPDGSYRPMPVIMTLEDGNRPTQPVNNPDASIFKDTYRAIRVNNINIDTAYSNKHFRLLYLDWKAILSWTPSTSPCHNPDNARRLNGVPACFSRYRLVQDVFPKLKFKDIEKCYHEALLPAGSLAPCDVDAYDNYGESPNPNIYPIAYRHNYGCYHCISDNLPYFRHTSSDDFAIRPDHFEFDGNSSSSYPDLLRSGQEYNLSLRALDGLGDPTKGYTTQANTLRLNSPNKYLKTGIIDNTLQGEANLSFSENNITDGISQGGDVRLSFNDVGRISQTIYDRNWASIDNDDTPQDCNSTKNANGDNIEASTYICGEVNATFIPHHFQVTATLNNHNGRPFTYYSNDLNMSANVEVKIKAMNAKDKVTKNFTKDLWEKELTVALNVTDWNTTLAQNITNYEANASIYDKRTDVKTHDIQNEIELGFGSGSNNDGEYTIETNATLAKRIMLNYARTYNSPRNPLDLNGKELNVTVEATYNSTSTPPAGEGTARIKGTTVGGGSALFYYGRVRPAKTFYHNVSADSQVTPVLIDVFCDISTDLNYTKCNNYGIATTDAEFAGNGLQWWLALRHDSTQNDGNVSLTINNGTLNKNTADILSGSNAKDNNIAVTISGQRPSTTDVSLGTGTNTWLITNPDNPNTTPALFEQVEFVGTSSWTGHGQTGNVVDSNASKKINKRLGW